MDALLCLVVRTAENSSEQLIQCHELPRQLLVQDQVKTEACTEA